MTTITTDELLDAALNHVPFDGWGDTTFSAAVRDMGITMEQGRALFPRGALDLAIAYHHRGDQNMVALMRGPEFDALRYSEKVAAAVYHRLAVAGDRELVRRGSTLFALPSHAGDGARLIWGTADAIWNALGDNSDDINWYSKRAILSGVYGSAVLFWLGDTSENDADTRAFIDRRIANVMQFEKLKSNIRNNEPLSKLLSIPGTLFSGIKAPTGHQRDDLPGRWGPAK